MELSKEMQIEIEKAVTSKMDTISKTSLRKLDILKQKLSLLQQTVTNFDLEDYKTAFAEHEEEFKKLVNEFEVVKDINDQQNKTLNSLLNAIELYHIEIDELKTEVANHLIKSTEERKTIVETTVNDMKDDIIQAVFLKMLEV